MTTKKNETKISGFRLSDQYKSKLRILAALDNSDSTKVLKRLINAEYKARQEEIKEFRERMKNKENECKNEKINDNES